MITTGDTPNQAEKSRISAENLTKPTVQGSERRSFSRRKLGHLYVGDTLRKLIDLHVENVPRWRFPRR